MFGEDYVTRMIQQMQPFFAGLAEMLHLRESKDYDKVIELIQSNSLGLLNMNMDLILHMPYEHLLAVLRDEMQEGRVRSLILAELLREAGETYEAQGKLSESYVCYVKAFNIFFEILFVKEDRTLPALFGPEEYQKRLDSLAFVAEKLRSLELPGSVLLRMMTYYEETKQYGRAEDTLFEALDTSDDLDTTVEAGIDFYKRLRFKSDEELIAGNLPRSEVEAGFRELLDQVEEMEASDE